MITSLPKALADRVWGRRTADERLMVIAAAFFGVVLILSSFLRFPLWLLTGFLASSAGLLGALWMRRLRFDVGTIAIVAGVVAYYFLYLTYTEYGERNYDGGEQLQYIEHIVKERSLPPPNKCLICHHPPLYYLTGAVVYSYWKATRVMDLATGLQVYGIVITFFFIVVGLLTVRLYVQDPKRIRVAAALLGLWPYAVHNAVRLHNDTLVTMLVAAAIYFALKAHKEGRRVDEDAGAAGAAARSSRPSLSLAWAGVFTAAGIYTKSTAYAMVPVLLAVAASRFWRGGARLRVVLQTGVSLLLIAGAMTLHTVRSGGQAATGNTLCHKVLGSACNVHKSALMDNDPYNYIYFDAEMFLREPYVLTDKDESGRQLFWNHLIKSSLFGSHNKVADRETAYEMNRQVATIGAAILLLMLAFFAAAVASAPRSAFRRYWPVWLSLGSLVGSLMAFRILLPAPHHTDFRLAFTAVVPTTLLYVAAVDHFERRGKLLGPLATGLAVAMSALSLFYWAPKYEWAMEMTRKEVPAELELYKEVVPDQSPWDRDGNLLFEGNHTVVFTTKRTTVKRVDISLDSNDRYEITLVGSRERRTIEVGPPKNMKPGMIRYQEEIDPPVNGVKEVRLRAIRGDRAYSMGHLILE